VRVWDLATGRPVGTPFTGHSGAVRAVAVAELEGRPVVVSGGDDRSVRVWDLATSGFAPKACSLSGEVSSIVLTGSTPHRTQAADSQLHVVICAADRAAFLKVPASKTVDTWEQSAAIQLSDRITAAAWHHPATLVVGTEAGIAVLQVAQA
jgi:WD40 repeat protein